MLKRIIFLFIVGLFMYSTLPAQDTAKIVVPTRVKNRMLMLFPQIQVVPVTWVKEGANFKGSLKILEKPAFAIIDTTGKLVRVERRLNVYYLPKKIITQLNKLYPGNEIIDIYELTNALEKKTYKITYQYKQTSVFNPEGELEK